MKPEGPPDRWKQCWICCYQNNHENAENCRAVEKYAGT